MRIPAVGLAALLLAACAAPDPGGQRADFVGSWNLALPGYAALEALQEKCRRDDAVGAPHECQRLRAGGRFDVREAANDKGLTFGYRVACNSFRGAFTVDGDTVRFGNTAGTLMACPDPLGEIDREIARRLALARTFKVNRRGNDVESIAVRDAAGAAVVVLSR